MACRPPTTHGRTRPPRDCCGTARSSRRHMPPPPPSRSERDPERDRRGVCMAARAPAATTRDRTRTYGRDDTVNDTVIVTPSGRILINAEAWLAARTAGIDEALTAELRAIG